MVRHLVELEINPNCLDEQGIPALHHALEVFGHQGLTPEGQEIANIILLNGGDPSIVSGGGSPESGLHVAARSGNVEVVLTLLRFGADTSICDANGRSALFAAAEAATEEWKIDSMIRYLVLNGADIEQKDSKGRRVLYIAAQKGLTVIILRLLRNFRAQRDAEDMEGKTPLEYARDGNKLDAVKLLEVLSR